ncbi:dual specificity protein kinase TTK-like [Oppia nitens]|uniref:dual specificity protein kinase TTK-like n=1 Tax=Oppia nitens TaxID=1686743 RepID=UPI0023DBEC22|nr:dual specificity protein kinase TTK-like [Oppia nitens]
MNGHLENSSTPSPPKSRLLSMTNYFNRQLPPTIPVTTTNNNNINNNNNNIKTSFVAKSCYTGWTTAGNHNNNNTANARLRATPATTKIDVSQRFQRLEKSGLLAKFRDFQTTKSVPLAMEADDDDDNDNGNDCDDEVDDNCDENVSEVVIGEQNEEQLGAEECRLKDNKVNGKRETRDDNKETKESSATTTTTTTTNSSDKSIRKIKVNKNYYQILNCIGQGGSSKVYQVYDSESQMTLALKIVDLTKADDQTVCGYKNEINLLSKLRKCKRVVHMYDYEYQNNGKHLLVVMEKGDSDLSNVLKVYIESEDRRTLDPHLIRFYWQQMLKAVDEIHSYGVVHSDLKPVNFILVAGKLKLIDFGIANAIQANYTSVYKESQIGTINYMAPEALQNRSDIRGKTVIKYNCKADVWSLGCILYNLVYGKTPFHHFNNLFQKANAIMDANHKINYPVIDDHLLLDCMKLCLRRDPNKRPTTKELLNHRYLLELKAPAPVAANAPQLALISQINNLTPNRMKQLSQVLEKLSKK